MIIKRFHKENLISKNITEGVKTESPKSPHFYLKSKLYKEGFPCRPVISSVNCHTSEISEYVGYHLQPIVWEIPFYVKDTSDFLRKINAVEFDPGNSHLISLLPRITWHKVIIHKTFQRRRYKGCKKASRQSSKANSGNKGN